MLHKASPETMQFLEEKARFMTSPELVRLQEEIDDLLKERERLFMAQTMTKEQLLKLYNGYGFYPKAGDKFWKIRHPDKGRGFYGWQVGQFEHSCHIDTTDLIVLYVIEPGEKSNSYITHCSDDWLEGPIIV